MVFNGHRLIWNGLSWPAVSGPFVRGRLPAGLYKVERTKIVLMTSKIKAGFKDTATGNGYFVPITPKFQTHRTGLGIHPDGNVPGTEGCIGLTSDSTGFYDRLCRTSPNAELTLQVKY